MLKGDTNMIRRIMTVSLGIASLLSACQEAAAAALGASRAEAVRAALRAIVTSHIDLRLLDPE